MPLSIVSRPPCAVTAVQGTGVIAPIFTPPVDPTTTMDIEWVDLCDDVNGDGSNVVRFLRSIIFDGTTGTKTVEDFLPDGITPYTLQGTITQCPEVKYQDVRTFCRVDDVNGDGTNVVAYYEAYNYMLTGAGFMSALIGTFADDGLTTAYTPINPTPADEIGAAAHTSQSRTVVQGGATWSPDGTMQSYTIRVVTDASGTITFTDSDGIVTSLVANEVLSFEADVNNVFDTTPVLSTGIGDVVIVSSTKIGA